MIIYLIYAQLQYMKAQHFTLSREATICKKYYKYKAFKLDIVINLGVGPNAKAFNSVI